MWSHTYVVSGEDGWLEELDVEGGDDDVLERLADLGVAEELPDDGAEVLAVVLGPQNEALDETQKAAPARRARDTAFRSDHSSRLPGLILCTSAMATNQSKKFSINHLLTGKILGLCRR